MAVEQGDGAAAIDRDSVLLDKVLASGETAAPVRLWVNPRCLVVPRAASRNPAFAAAAALSDAAGWPVYLRDSGGATVVHRPGILNVSLFSTRPSDGLAIDALYGRLVALLVAGFAALGTAADVGPVPGSYCDGRFNIRVAGRKIAGTACRVRRTNLSTAIVAHAVVSVEGDPAPDVAAVSAFERLLGLPGAYRADRHCTLEQVLGRPDVSRYCRISVIPSTKGERGSASGVRD